MSDDQSRYRLHQARLPGRDPTLGRRTLHRWVDHLTQPITIVRNYQRSDLFPDLLAGLTVAMVALPQAIAYASIAKLPAHYGLYAAIVAAVVGSLWGSSRHLSSGPTNAASILMLSILAPLVTVGSGAFLVASSLMAVLVGLLRVAFGLSGLGMLVNFVSRAVLLGFTAGAGVLIAVSQLGAFLGVTIPGNPGPLATLLYVARHLGEVHGASLALGGGALLVTLALNLITRKFPGALAALIGVTAVVAALGVEKLGVKVVGEIPGAVPQPTDLKAAWELVRGGAAGEMLTGALAVSLLGLVEAVSITRTIARASGQRLDVNQEFVGQGLANIAAGLLSGYTCSGSFIRSAVNQRAGARTQIAGVFTGIFILAGAVLMAGHLAYLPRAGLAGVIMLVAWGMIDRASIRRVLRASRGEAAVLGVTFLATLLAPLEFAVLSGVIFSLAMYVYRSSTPRVIRAVPDATFRHFVEKPEAPSCTQLAVMTQRGPLFFGATQHVEEALLQNLAEHPEQRFLLLRMHGVDQCDFTGIEMLEGMVRTYRERDGDVFMVQVRPPVRRIMEQTGFVDLLGASNFLEQETAIDHLFQEVIDPAVCWYHCPNRVFAECQALAKRRYELAIPPQRPRTIDPSYHLSVEQLEPLMHDKATLIIDVREPSEYRVGHLHGSVLMPLSELILEAETLPRERRIVLVCRSGRRSTRGLRLLLDLGYTRVFNLRGGILSWKASDRPIESA